jgi:hypothetical protein
LAGETGRIVVRRTSPSGGSRTAMLDLSAADWLDLNDNDEWIEDVAEAPSKDRLAFVHFLRDEGTLARRLEVVDQTGNTLQAFEMADNWFGLAGWLDGARLIIRTERAIPGTERHTVAFPIVLDTANGATFVLARDYPGMTDTVPAPDIRGYGPVVYDPQLTRALYPVGPSMTALAVYDLLSTTEITEIPVAGGFNPPSVAWTSDGNRFATVALSAESILSLTVFDREGLASNVLAEDGLLEWTEWWSFVWSPDSRQLAFVVVDSDWYDSTGEFRSYPAVIDASTGAMHSFQTYGYGISGLKAPIWSPDGRYLLLGSHGVDASPCSVILDVTTAESRRLPDASEPLAWISSPS